MARDRQLAIQNGVFGSPVESGGSELRRVDRPMGERLQPLLTLPEVAALLRVHEKTVCGWVRKRELPCIRLGGRLRFDQRDVLRWLSARKEG